MCTVLFIFLLVLDGFLDRAGEFVRMPPGLGRPEICDIDALLCSSDVFGS